MANYAIDTNDYVTVGNRTSKPLKATFDGRTWDLPPYPATRMLHPFVATHAVRQNPVMGTEDPYNAMDCEYLVYVKEWKMPAKPIEQSDKPERLDRSLLPPSAQNAQLVEHRRPRVVRDPIAAENTQFVGERV